MQHRLDEVLGREVEASEREFYALFGLVAMRFAHLEAKLTGLLSTMIHPSDALLAATLTEDIFAAKTIELIKKVGRIRSINDKRLEEIISESNSFRNDRNDYAHGVWKVEATEDGDVVASCSRRRIHFKRSGTSKCWTQKHNWKPVTPEQLGDTALRLEGLIRRIEKLTNEIEADPDIFMF